MKYEEYEKQVIAEAKVFVACDFRGRATYARSEHETKQAAERAARRLIRQRPANTYSKGRPVLVYAVVGTQQVVAATVYP